MWKWKERSFEHLEGDALHTFGLSCLESAILGGACEQCINATTLSVAIIIIIIILGGACEQCATTVNVVSNRQCHHRRRHHRSFFFAPILCVSA